MFCGGHTGLVFFLSAMYINPQVTYRYNAVALPAAALLLIAALGSLATRLSPASRERATNGDDRVDAKRASMATRTPKTCRDRRPNTAGWRSVPGFR